MEKHLPCSHILRHWAVDHLSKHSWVNTMFAKEITGELLMLRQCFPSISHSQANLKMLRSSKSVGLAKTAWDKIHCSCIAAITAWSKTDIGNNLSFRDLLGLTFSSGHTHIHIISLSTEICRSLRNEIRSTHPRTNCHHYNAFSDTPWKCIVRVPTGMGGTKFKFWALSW